MPAFHARLRFGRLYLVVAALVLSILFFEVVPALSQSELATVFGRVTDPSGAVVAGAEVEVRNVDTGISVTSATNADGLYTVPSLHPGHYVISVRKPGFRSVSATGLELNVQDNVARNFSLQVGSAAESITVNAEADKINTTDGSVSTVVDRQFAENLPMNGRSFQTLIDLTPGVAATVSNARDNGQFSINGQRASANYWMVDGVSANIGIGSNNSANAGNGFAGASASFSVLGGTNSLVSVDAMQEFRIQTSTYAPEFGRTPGGQISITTRSGANTFHGSAFDYFRNDALDAGNWFNGFTNNPPLPKARERQNDFGGTFSGPVFRNRTFFFFSYEGLRLRLPQTAQSNVPDLATRQSATPAMQPFLSSFPLPNGPDNAATGVARFSATYSDPATLDAYSLRVDHKVTNGLSLFGRYAYSPSDLLQRGNGSSLSTVFSTKIATQTFTVGATWMASPEFVNDLRLNYSRTNNESHSFLDNFGGAKPLQSLPFPSQFNLTNGQLFLDVFTGSNFSVGPQGHNVQRQFNLIETVSIQKGSHGLKLGADYRRLTPIFGNPAYVQEALFFDMSSFASGSPFLSFVTSTHGEVPFWLHNLGLFAQDTWRATPRLTFTYGVRWDLDTAPSSDPNLVAVSGFSLNDLSRLVVAPSGTPPFKTSYTNFAPRFGLAYQVWPASQNWQTVIRAGAGVFYDLATSELGNILSPFFYPMGKNKLVSGGAYPLDPTASAPPPITADFARGTVFSFDPHLKLPYSAQWSLALEQSLARGQEISATYVGSMGRRLIQSTSVSAPNANFGAATLVTNAASSDYDALQLAYKKRLSDGMQALVSYTWSHSIDTASAGSVYGNQANDLVPSFNPNSNRGPSDFDLRHSVSAGVTYDIPAAHAPRVISPVVEGWSLDLLAQAHSAVPVTIYDGSVFNLSTGAVSFIRPDVVPGQSLYLSGLGCSAGFQSAGELPAGSMCPGGKGFNPNAFITPPLDANGRALRQGTLARNALRGFGAAQFDFAVHREISVRESLKLQFRAEMFNVLNHPNFGPPVQDISNKAQFGLANQMLGQYLSGGNVGSGGFSSLYQIGGPRSIQLALKLMF